LPFHGERPQQFDGFGREMGSGKALLQQEFGQGLQCRRTLSQRRDAQLELIEPVEKIAAGKRPSWTACSRIHIGGGNDANVDANLARLPPRR